MFLVWQFIMHILGEFYQEKIMWGEIPSCKHMHPRSREQRKISQMHFPIIDRLWLLKQQLLNYERHSIKRQTRAQGRWNHVYPCTLVPK